MNFYNEFDPKAAAWLRELIAAGHIPPGVVDERSIADIQPHELTPYTQCHFFAGLGGWALALQLAGVSPKTPLGTGSCPCQPYSAAGKQLGDADPRNLWPVFFRLIVGCRALGQRWAFLVFGEQVASAIGHGWLDGISADLERENYACGSVVLGAHSVGAPHIRQRLYWVANSQGEGRQGVEPQREAGQCERPRTRSGGAACGVDDTASARCDGQERDAKSDSRHETRLRVSGFGSEAERLGDPESRGCGELRDAAQPRRGGYPERSGGAGLGGMGEPNGTGWEQGQPSASTAGHWAPAESASGAWDNCDVIACRDGKSRRIPGGPQPGFQFVFDGLPEDMDAGWCESNGAIRPLAQGVKGRVGLLKGSGNAIVPQVAAEFIRAAMDTLATATAAAP